METHVFLAVLAAALLHAGWNSVVKVGLDRFSTVVLLALVQACIAVPVLAVVPHPALDAWPWIVGAGLLHTGYKVFLIKAYEHSDLSLAYPIARGTAPLIVFLFSVTVLGVDFLPKEVAAILAISLGLFLMTLRGEAGGRMRGQALFFALGTAVFTASYTIVDGMGARVAGTPSGFILWMVIGDAIGMLGYALWRRGPGCVAALLPAWKMGLSAGAMSLGSYWIAVWAFTVAPIALVAALRESSIVFATLIATFLLRESVGRWRWVSAFLIAAGVAGMKAS